jgi:thiol-disulfide isomerase/thioredoxin
VSAILNIRTGMKLVRFVMAVFALSTPAAATAGQTVPDCAWTPAGASEATGPGHFRGKVLYVDFWASWCAPCVVSFPFMNRLDRDFRSKGLQIVAVDMDQHAGDGEAFLADHRASFTIAGGANGACARAFGVKAMPTSFIVDRNGAIRETVQGFRGANEEHLRDLIGQLLAEPAKP